MAANRMLVERALPDPPGDGRCHPARRPRRSVTINLAESPLGWLHARGHIDARQFEAGERLRADWERAQLAPSVTMRWDATRLGGRAGSSAGADRPRPSSPPNPVSRLPSPKSVPVSTTCSGASSARAKACARPNARSAGPPALASSSSPSPSTGWPLTIGSGDAHAHITREHHELSGILRTRANACETHLRCLRRQALASAGVLSLASTPGTSPPRIHSTAACACRAVVS